MTLTQIYTHTHTKSSRYAMLTVFTGQLHWNLPLTCSLALPSPGGQHIPVLTFTRKRSIGADTNLITHLNQDSGPHLEVKREYLSGKVRSIMTLLKKRHVYMFWKQLWFTKFYSKSWHNQREKQLIWITRISYFYEI